MNVIAAVIVVVFPQFELPGTQPGELNNTLSTASACDGCHSGYADYAPTDTWAGSMMANAMRDPLFLAALTIANQDVPGSGDLCIRCHSPRGWLFGRAQPTDGSALEPADYEGVQCDFCHRLAEGPGGQRNIGNGQFFVADDYIRRGTIQNTTVAPHAWEYSPYHESSELCGVCHDVSNPLNAFAVERTYTEWLNSDYALAGVSCQECHTPKVDQAYAAIPSSGAPPRRVGRHDLAGGNTWIPMVLAGEYPQLGLQAAYEYTAARAEEMLQQSAELTFRVDGAPADPQSPPAASAGRNFPLTVRVENLTGHKLPTGYPEGRRSWLEVKVADSTGRVVYHSGGYDLETATRSEDPDLHTYEVRLASNGVEGFHFMTANEVLQDNRIPPQGFRPTPETTPVGRNYPEVARGVLAHWDDAAYRIRIPDDATLGPALVTATLWYQTTSREYVEFLRDENHTDNRGEEMYRMWQQYGKSAPVAMATVTLDIEIQEAPPGCGCRVPGSSQGVGDKAGAQAVPWLLGLALLVLVRRRRARQHCQR
jgi:MYXO-CTERM domain-containing protein